MYRDEVKKHRPYVWKNQLLPHQKYTLMRVREGGREGGSVKIEIILIHTYMYVHVHVHGNGWFIIYSLLFVCFVLQLEVLCKQMVPLEI